MSKNRTISVKILFTERDLNKMLAAANFTDSPPLTVDKLSDKQFKLLKKYLKDTPFNHELVDSSRANCANGWLEGFEPKE